jgi:hypothetical protein
MEKDIRYTKLLKQQISTFQQEKRFLEFKSNYQDAEKKRWKLTEEFKRTFK